MKALPKPTKHGLQAEKALKMAVKGVIEEHRRLGLPIAVMKDGKAVYVNLDPKIPVAREPKKAYRAKK
jgi:hypothetical protein